MFVNYMKLNEIIMDLKKYDFASLEKQGKARMLLVTGADLYANKNYIASMVGDDVKASEVERELPKLLEDFDSKMHVIGKDIKDGSVSYGIMFVINGQLKNYVNGIEYLEKHYKRG